jgi:hypothetical protein
MLAFKHEIRPGMVFSADYIRNIGEHFLIVSDVNRSGAARSFNLKNAIAARDAAQTANGCLAGPVQGTCMVTTLGQSGAQAAYSAAGFGFEHPGHGWSTLSSLRVPGDQPRPREHRRDGRLGYAFPSWPFGLQRSANEARSKGD